MLEMLADTAMKELRRDGDADPSATQPKQPHQWRTHTLSWQRISLNTQARYKFCVPLDAPVERDTWKDVAVISCSSIATKLIADLTCWNFIFFESIIKRNIRNLMLAFF